MKVYSEIVLSMETGEVLHEEYEVYDGPLALCDGGPGAGSGGGEAGSPIGDGEGQGSGLGGGSIGGIGTGNTAGNFGGEATGVASPEGTGNTTGSPGVVGGGISGNFGGESTGLGSPESTGNPQGGVEGNTDAGIDGVDEGLSNSLSQDSLDAAQQSVANTVQAELNSMSQQSTSLGFSTTAAKGGMAVGTAFGGPVVGAVIGGLSGLLGGMSTSQSDPSEATAIGNLTSAGLIGDSPSNNNDGSFGGVPGGGSPNAGGPADVGTDLITDESVFKAPEENPPVVNPPPEENPPVEVGSDFYDARAITDEYRQRYGYTDVFRFKGDNEYDIFVPTLKGLV